MKRVFVLCPCGGSKGSFDRESVLAHCIGLTFCFNTMVIMCQSYKNKETSKEVCSSSLGFYRVLHPWVVHPSGGGAWWFVNHTLPGGLSAECWHFLFLVQGSLGPRGWIMTLELSPMPNFPSDETNHCLVRFVVLHGKPRKLVTHCYRMILETASIIAK